MSYREPSIAALFAEVKQLHRRLEYQESKLHDVLGKSKAPHDRQRVSHKQYKSSPNDKKGSKAGYMQPTKARIAAIPPELVPKLTKSPRRKLTRNVHCDSSPPAIPKQLDINKIQQMLEDDNLDMSILLEVKDLLTISIKQSEAWLNNVDNMLANADDARLPSAYHQTVQRLLANRQSEPVIIFRSPVERKIALLARKSIEYTQDKQPAPSPTSRSEFLSPRQPVMSSHVLNAAQADHDHDLDTNVRLLIERQATYFNQRESALITLPEQQSLAIIKVESTEERYDDQFDDFSSTLLSPSATIVPPLHALSSSYITASGINKAISEDEEAAEEKDMDTFRSTLTSLRSRLDLLLVDEDEASSVIKQAGATESSSSITSSKPHKQIKLHRKKKKRTSSSNTTIKINRNTSNGSPVSLSDNSSYQSSISSNTSGSSSGRMKVILPKMNSKSLAAREVILERAEIREEERRRWLLDSSSQMTF